MSPLDDSTVRRDVQDLLNSSHGLKANFVVLAGADIGRKYPIDQPSFSIGRSESCDIFINDEDVSRTHVKIEVAPTGIILKDLGSTNGTLVNGLRVTKHILSDGDRIQIGNVTVLKFNFSDEIEDTYNEQLYSAANMDFLTQTYNKKYFLDRLRMEISFARRHETSLSLILFDVDFFKQVNDRFGHVAGDNILRQLATHITSIKRHEDLFARFGGEEFVLLLRDTHRGTAISIAHKLRSRVNEFTFVVDAQEIQLSISVGVATFYRNNYKNDETFLRAADRQLYRAKREGRNQVQFANEEPCTSLTPEEEG